MNSYNQLREEIHFTEGRVIVRGKAVSRGESKKADYILYYKPNIPIAVIEAKDNKNHHDTDSFGRDDLPLVAKLDDQAHMFIFDRLAKLKLKQSE